MTLLRKAAIAALYAIVFTMTLELLARIDDRITYGASLGGRPSMDDLVLADAHGVRGRPGARFQKWSLNSLGFQGVEARATKPPGVFRVIVFGSSESFGLYEHPGMSYPARLQGLLETRLGRPVEVLNGALPGLTMPRIVDFWNTRLGELAPDVVVYYATPVAYLDEYPPSEGFQAPSSVAPPGFEWRSLPRLANGLNRSLPARVQEWRLKRGLRRALDRYRQSHPPEWVYRELPTNRVRLFEKHLRALVHAVKLSGARLVLATHAHRFHRPLRPEDEVHLLSWQAFYPRAEPDVLLDMERAANELIRAQAAASGAGYADVAAVLDQPDHFADFSHFTDQGSAVAAAEVMRAIIEPGRPGPVTTQPDP